MTRSMVTLGSRGLNATLNPPHARNLRAAEIGKRLFMPLALDSDTPIESTM
jgi:hypothetical protein